MQMRLPLGQMQSPLRAKATAIVIGQMQAPLSYGKYKCKRHCHRPIVSAIVIGQTFNASAFVIGQMQVPDQLDLCWANPTNFLKSIE